MKDRFWIENLDNFLWISSFSEVVLPSVMDGKHHISVLSYLARFTFLTWLICDRTDASHLYSFIQFLAPADKISTLFRKSQTANLL